MNNFKKFVAVLLGVVMACVFATSAFASESKANTIIAKMNAYGLTGFDEVIKSLDDAQQQVLLDNSDALIAQADQVLAYNYDNHSAEDTANNAKAALNNVSGILSKAGITASVDVAVNGNTITVVPTASSKTKSATGTTKTWTVDPSQARNQTATTAAVDNAAKNSAAASSVKTVSSAANPITASSSAVIKATGDNSAVVFVAAALAVAGVLGMAVRKERAL